MKKKIMSLLLAACLLLSLLPSGSVFAGAQETEELYLQMLDLGLVDEDGKLIEDNTFTLEDGTRLASLGKLVEWLGQCGEEDMETLVYVDSTGMGTQAQMMIYALSIEFGMEELADQLRLLSSVDTLSLTSSELDGRKLMHRLTFQQTVSVDRSSYIAAVTLTLKDNGTTTVAAPFDVVLETGLFSEYLPDSGKALDVAASGESFTPGSNCYKCITIPAGQESVTFRISLQKLCHRINEAEKEFWDGKKVAKVLWDGNCYVLLQTRSASGMAECSQRCIMPLETEEKIKDAPEEALDFLENGGYPAVQTGSGSSMVLSPFGKDAMLKLEKTSMSGKSLYMTINAYLAHRQLGNGAFEQYCAQAFKAGMGAPGDPAVLIQDLSFVTKYDESALSKAPTLYYGVTDSSGKLTRIEEVFTTQAEMAVQLVNVNLTSEDKYKYFLSSNMQGNWGQDFLEQENAVLHDQYVDSLLKGDRQVIRYRQVEMPLLNNGNGTYTIPSVWLIDSAWDSQNAGIEGVCVPGKVYLNDTTAPTVTAIRTTSSYITGWEDGKPIYQDDVVYRPGEYVPITVTFSEPVRGEYKLVYTTVDENDDVIYHLLDSVHSSDPDAVETGLTRDDSSLVSSSRLFYFPVDKTHTGSIQIAGVCGTDATDLRGNLLVQNVAESTLDINFAKFETEAGNRGGMRPQDGVVRLQLAADTATPIANPRKYTATMEIPNISALKQAWVAWGDDNGDGSFAALEAAFVVDGDLSVKYPVTMTKDGRFISEMLLPNVEQPTEHILELYLSNQDGVYIGSAGTGCVCFTQQPLVEATEDAYTIQADEWYSGIEGTIFMMDKKVPQFTAVDNGIDFTYKNDTMVYWSNSNENVLKVRGSSADAPVTLAEGKTILLDRVSEGETTLQLMATNGSDDPADHTAVSAPITVRLEDGGTPVLMFPENGNTVLALQNTDQVANFTANLQKHKVVDGKIQVELFEGDTISEAATPLYTDDLPQSAKSVTIPGQWLKKLSVDGKAAYTLRLSAQVELEAQTVDMTTLAYLVVEPRPAKVRLQGLSETILVCDQDIPIHWSVTDFALDTNLDDCEFEFIVERNGESIYKTYRKKDSGSYLLHLPTPDALKDEYIITARATNGNGSGWSTDSRTLTVYNRSALKLTANGQELGEVLNLQNTVSSSTTTTSPVVTTYDGQVFDGLSDAQSIARLRTELSLMQTIFTISLRCPS